MSQSTTADPFVKAFLTLVKEHADNLNLPKMTLEVAVGMLLGAGVEREKIIEAVNETCIQYEKEMAKVAAKGTENP